MKSLLDKLAHKLIPILGYLLALLFYYTNKKTYKIESDFPEEPVVVALWHGEMLMIPFIYHHLRKKKNLIAMISEHKDGELVGKLFQYTGVGNIRGSSSRGAARVFLSAIKEIKNGKDIAITPDGPRGPRFSIADGIVALSNKTGAPIVAMRVKATKHWELKSWDRFLIPKPFGEIVYEVSAPFSVKDLEKEEAKNKISSKLGVERVV
ncbi:MAG: lysophospholipid acyltransferase family protein [Campylobacterales bacterium]|nr:lysophospholipid acyltransferase family protein [Campylobacterales bacterium]